jgi:transposase
MKKVDASKLIFIDETGCNTQLALLYGWAPSGDRLVDTRPCRRSKNITVVGAIRSDKFLCHAKFEAALNGARWVSFVREKLVPHLRAGDFVVLDNLQIHKNLQARRLIEAAGASLVFLPPYSPELNPIEMCWSFVKQWLRRMRERSSEALKRAIWRALLRVTTRHLSGWFDACGYPLLN